MEQPSGSDESEVSNVSRLSNLSDLQSGEGQDGEQSKLFSKIYNQKAPSLRKAAQDYKRGEKIKFRIPKRPKRAGHATSPGSPIGSGRAPLSPGSPGSYPRTQPASPGSPVQEESNRFDPVAALRQLSLQDSDLEEKGGQEDASELTCGANMNLPGWDGFSRGEGSPSGKKGSASPEHEASRDDLNGDSKPNSPEKPNQTFANAQPSLFQRMVHHDAGEEDWDAEEGVGDYGEEVLNATSRLSQGALAASGFRPNPADLPRPDAVQEDVHASEDAADEEAKQPLSNPLEDLLRSPPAPVHEKPEPKNPPASGPGRQYSSNIPGLYDMDEEDRRRGDLLEEPSIRLLSRRQMMHQIEFYKGKFMQYKAEDPSLVVPDDEEEMQEAKNGDIQALESVLLRWQQALDLKQRKDRMEAWVDDKIDQFVTFATYAEMIDQQVGPFLKLKGTAEKLKRKLEDRRHDFRRWYVRTCNAGESDPAKAIYRAITSFYVMHILEKGVLTVIGKGIQRLRKPDTTQWNQTDSTTSAWAANPPAPAEAAPTSASSAWNTPGTAAPSASSYNVQPPYSSSYPQYGWQGSNPPPGSPANGSSNTWGNQGQWPGAWPTPQPSFPPGPSGASWNPTSAWNTPGPGQPAAPNGTTPAPGASNPPKVKRKFDPFF